MTDRQSGRQTDGRKDGRSQWEKQYVSRPFEGGDVSSRQELENSVHHCYMAPDEATTSGLLCCSIFFTKLAITILFSRIPNTVRVSSSLDPDQAQHDKLYIQSTLVTSNSKGLDEICRVISSLR